MGRAFQLGLPWLVVMAISCAIAYGTSVAVMSPRSTSTGSAASVPTVFDRPVGSQQSSNGNNWILQVGPNCWLPDPSGLMRCPSPTTASDH